MIRGFLLNYLVSSASIVQVNWYLREVQASRRFPVRWKNGSQKIKCRISANFAKQKIKQQRRLEVLCVVRYIYQRHDRSRFIRELCVQTRKATMVFESFLHGEFSSNFTPRRFFMMWMEKSLKFLNKKGKHDVDESIKLLCNLLTKF